MIRVEFTESMGPGEWLRLFRERIARHGEAAHFSGREVAHITSASAMIALRAARPVLEYVSRGRGFVDVEPYPDAGARRALATTSTPEGP